ncbi:MAG: methylated-DNA--[protein]-cysteine S-methyltransferase, partial [Lachnospiraceae bacterium]|nr:methylated-DNA--[protein]-cysteine S-methyltransferase [Lachnospiraceae bacterium]
YYRSPIGTLMISDNGKELIGLTLSANGCQTENSSKTSVVSQKLSVQLDEYFSGKRKNFDIPIHFGGTDFQNKVWYELTQIPYGCTKSYGEIARAIGNPKSCRAVGGANNKNPIMIVVPCHRVIGADGKLVGYAHGTEMKKFLLELEQEYI